MATARKTVEWTLNITIIFACVLIASTFLTHKNLSITGPSSEEAEAHLKGQELPPLFGYSWGSRRETLVVALRKGCHYCEASLPFYKQLSDLEKNNSLHAHLLVVMPDDQDSGGKELQSSGLAVDSLFGQSLDSIKVTGTPALLLLDSHGRVAQAWMGQLTPERERDVIAALKR